MKDEMQVFLLIGQSNMAGRGRLGEVAPLVDDRVLMYREGQWVKAKEPLHTDKPERAGVGLGMSFAIELLKVRPGVRIGLVPCAVGGTPLSRWVPGADLYENAVAVCREALAEGKLKGILWHQGESDSGSGEDAGSYGVRFRAMIESLRRQFNSPGVPVVAGELGEFIKDRDEFGYFDTVNRQLREMEGEVPVYGCVSSEGLGDNGDMAHFNAAALREFGVRYARKYLELECTRAEWEKQR